MMKKTRVLIMGAAGRDFHNFNVYFRDNEDYEVIAFTAEQIPNISNRIYPPILSGRLYPKGIPIYPERKLSELIHEYKIDQCIFSYSDISYNYLMNRSSEVLAAGADFKLLGPKRTMIKSQKPVISICAVRTGCGKSQTSRKVIELLRKKGKRVVAVRHPMPYGDVTKQICQRFSDYSDLEKHDCTIEEREEYEPYLELGLVVYAGEDYEKILREAEKEADIIVWDGGNNDLPFYKPDLHIVVADPHRPGHEIKYFPGEVNARMADIILINKINTAQEENISVVERNIKDINSKAKIIKANSIISVENPDLIKGKRVLVIEDGPTLTHGGASFGAGVVAAREHNCEIVDPRPCATSTIKDIFEKYPHLKNVLPAMGYGPKQMGDLNQTINNCDCDVVLVATPMDLGRLLNVAKPIVRVKYELGQQSSLELDKLLDDFLVRDFTV